MSLYLYPLKNFFHLAELEQYLVFMHGILRKELPFWDNFLYEILRIEVLQDQRRTEPAAVVAIAIVDIRMEHSRNSAISVMASAHHERVRRIS